jgi:hypothetical protein
VNRLLHFTAIAAALGLVAFLSPPPDHVTDRGVYEAVAAHGIVADCTDLHCFRVLVPWALGALPGSSDMRWKTYAVLANAAAAIAVFQLCLTFGLTRRGAWLASTASAFGCGSLYTLHDCFTADPLMFAMGPILIDLLLRGRLAVAGVMAAAGVFAKEFAAVPLFIGSAAAALARRWEEAARTLVAANTAFIFWLALQLTLMLRFNYGYGGTSSANFLSGAGVGPWLAQQSLRGVFSAMLDEYGAFYLLAPVGFFFAPAALRRMTIAALPAALVLCYVQQPDRALWNFHMLVVPLGVLVLERVSNLLAWMTVGIFAVANLRVGAQLPQVPAARFAIAVSMMLAIIASVRAWRADAIARPMAVGA